ncbi:bifunctional serine/threonine-protein kinase/ABC transporter substrate-binding protein [Pendulispora rubella]|uniref:non-specific serine/threonine protein kinase n=1 Tax=Pendulispora rubella TaxID=2741070 RepID=A0ABZ2LB14_9BACT
MNQSRAAAKHRLLIELGRGGMGTVYLATRRDQVVDRPALVVVKHLRAELASHLRFLQGFLDESHLAMRLDHANIVRTWDVGFEARHYFLEMEYLEGQTLDVLMRTASPNGLPWAVGLFLLEQVLAGLHYAHELTDAHGRPLSIVHRDVSPHNVLVTYDGTVKLLDFGIAKAAISSHETSTGIIKGKITYMAPEQAGRRHVDRRADVFSVGVMLWQCLTGQRLWADVPEPLLFHKLDRGEIDPPSTIRPDVPEALEAICMKALALEPVARYSTAEELRVALSHERRARWGDVGRAELARTMTDYFAERRAADKAQIDALLVRGLDESLEVLPVLGQGPALPVIAVGLDPAGRTSTGTRTEPHHGNSKTVRRRRVPRWALGAAVATVAGAAGIGVASRAGLYSAGTESAKADAPPSACTSNAACVKQNDGRGGLICRRATDGACVSLEAPGCKVLAEKGDVENDATIWFGAMFPMSGKFAEAFGLESVNAIDLARRDFVQIARGIPSPSSSGPGKPARPIGIIACDDAVNPRESARHLVDLQVPAVIGFSSSQEVIDLATESFIPNGILAVATQNRSSLITTIPHPPNEPRLVWRTTFNTAVNMIPVSAVVAEVIEPSLRASHVLRPDEAMRVVHLRIRNTTGLSGSDALLGTLRFNGKSAVENGSNYLELLYTNPQDPQPIADSSIVDALLKFRPHVVISAGFDTNTKTVLAPFETRWPKSERYRPRYVVAGMYGDDFFQLLGKNTERRRRFMGVGLPTSTLVNAKLTMHYNETYTPKVTQSGAPGAVYDAAYLLAYAAYAMGDLPMTGSNLARGMARLVPPGEPIDVGPTKIFEAFRLLQEGKSIDLRGAATPLDFDLATGESPIDFALLCAGTDERGMANEAIEPGPIFRAAAKKIEGLPLRCP